MSTYNFSNDPFADPTIAAATNQNNVANSGLEDYNPFANQPTRNVDPFSPTTTTAVVTEPPTAVLSPTTTFQKSEPPPSYSQSTANNLTAEQLRQRQEELDRRAAELAAREAELQRAQRLTNRENNFPPLPSFFPCKPCFYQDINVEIEIDFQNVVRQVYQLWLFYIGTLFLNFLGCLVSLIEGVENGAGMLFFSIVTIFIFTPLSFLFWFRPLYKAFRDDSSFNFMVFFFVFFCQFMLSIFWALGIPGTGAIGLFTAIGSLSKSVSVFYRLLCFVCTIVLIVYSLASLYILVKVRGIYSNSSASFEKAQAEFTTKVLSNERVQQMASTAAQGAARQAMNQAFQQSNAGNNANNTNSASGFRY